MNSGKYDKEEIVHQWKKGKKPAEIAEMIGCSLSTVKKTIKKYRPKEEGLTEKKLFEYEWWRATAAVKKVMGYT